MRIHQRQGVAAIAAIAFVGLAPLASSTMVGSALADNSTPTSIMTPAPQSDNQHAVTRTVSGVYTVKKATLQAGRNAQAGLDTKGEFYADAPHVYDAWVTDTVNRLGSRWYNHYGSAGSFQRLVDAGILPAKDGADAMRTVSPETAKAINRKYRKSAPEGRAKVYRVFADFERETRNDAARAANNVGSQVDKTLGANRSLADLVNAAVHAVYPYLTVPKSIEVKVDKDRNIVPRRDFSGHELGAIERVTEMDRITQEGQPDTRRLRDVAEQAQEELPADQRQESTTAPTPNQTTTAPRTSTQQESAPTPQPEATETTAGDESEGSNPSSGNEYATRGAKAADSLHKAKQSAGLS